MDTRAHASHAGHAHGHSHHAPQPSDSAVGLKDPVCGMTVNPAGAPATREYEGKTYFFCNPGCAETFDKDPAKYAA